MEEPLETSSNVQLLNYCATHLNETACWDEFVKRYQQVIMRSVNCAHRRFMRGTYAPAWRVSELVQEVYLRLLKDECELLRRFRGVTERSAEAYLAQIAINITGDELRREMARKRRVKTDSFEETHLADAAPWHAEQFTLPEGLAERELIRLLARDATGDKWRRDVLIFLLHIRVGMTAQEIAQSGFCKLQPASITSAIIRLRGRLKKALQHM